MQSPELKRALKIALAIFPAGPVTVEQINQNCDLALELLENLGEGVPERSELMRALETVVMVVQPQSEMLQGEDKHEPWLFNRDVEWKLWDRYRRYLAEVELMPPAVIQRLDESTSRVLDKLEPPELPGPWDRRGLVVGHVQSGKTGHYTGLACKAADVGYKLIIVLAGMHNSLRSQTQLRLDEGLLGFDTQFQQRADDAQGKWIGVGALAGAQKVAIGSFTTSAEGGDFKKAIAQAAAIPLGSMPITLVVKKNASILRNLYEWLMWMEGTANADAHKGQVIRNVPLLLIDDEADNASVNTADADTDPTKINGLLRDILATFEKSSYVGYTATPFANIFVDSDDDQVPKHGRDIYPDDFIESLKAPSNYFGPQRLFGASEDDEPLPLLRAIDDHQLWMPDKHKKTWRPKASLMPASLRSAVYSYFLACAARAARGQETSHNSMLIHVTSYQAVQAEVASQIDDFVKESAYRLKYGDGAGQDLRSVLRALWETDFERTSAHNEWKASVQQLAWSDVEPRLLAAVAKIEVKVINGTSTDALQYFENKNNGLSVIAVGGNKLSRGLTLEGLTVSYFLRTSKMWDTLMQMGRWFGYRPGYEDMCRLFMTPELRNGYREIAEAMEELRRDFDDMAARGASPKEYGLRVRQSEAGFLVTSPNKQRAAKSITLTFAGQNPQTVVFSLAEQVVKANREALQVLVQSCDGSAVPVSGNYVWRAQDASIVLQFLKSYRHHPQAKRAAPQLIHEYITQCLANDELSEWTIALISNSKAANIDHEIINGIPLGLTVRRFSEDSVEEVESTQHYSFKAVISPRDEQLDLSEEQIRQAKSLVTGDNADSDSVLAPKCREVRDPKCGLLLLYVIDPSSKDGPLGWDPLVGFAFSFPGSPTANRVKFLANRVLYKQLMWEDEDSDDDNS